jgi:deazaflavin-dependent oxidoreductase (nitroreductase family)
MHEYASRVIVLSRLAESLIAVPGAFIARFRRAASLYMLAVEARYIVPETFQKESSLDRFFNRLMGRALKLGFAPGYMRLLEVRGRKSGKTFTTPVNLIDVSGRRYLVAARGETAWARNARAAGHIVLRRGSATESFMVREIADADKPEIIKAFLDKFASQVQRFFDVPAGSPADAFRATASRTPVFELVAGA